MNFLGSCYTALHTPTSTLTVYDNWLQEADLLLQQCSQLSLEVEPKFQMFGKTCCMHRCIGFFSDSSAGYRYSRQISESQPLPDFLDKLLEKVNMQFHSRYNGILVNLYRDKNDYISKHSDNEAELDSTAGVVALSLGASRIFRIRDRTGAIVKDIPTQHGQLICMSGDFQKEFTHEIPRGGTGMRISLTFRVHN
jgi:alkylated DNA repair dioxygenase AlkB